MAGKLCDRCVQMPGRCSVMTAGNYIEERREMKMKSLIAGALLLAIPLSSQAICTLHGNVIRVQNTANEINPKNFIYLRSSTSADSNVYRNDHYYIGSTPDDALAQAASIALANGTTVFVSADAATCPDTGATRIIGNIRAIILAP